MELWNKLKQRFSLQAPLSAQALDELITKIARLLSYLEQLAGTRLAARASHVQTIAGEFNSLKGSLTGTDGKIDPNKWNPKEETERRRIGIALNGLWRELRCLNQDELCRGWSHFVTFMVILVVVSIVYIVEHRGQLSGVVNAEAIIDTGKHLRTIESEINEIRKIKDPSPDLKKKVIDAMRTLREDAKKFDLSAPVLLLLGTVEADTERNDLDEVGKSFAKLFKMLTAELESSGSGFLWSDRRGRWLEIVLWAELGTLVGILFYIAGCLSTGRFEVAETAMLWAEAAIAPLVVLAIFFLFGLTGITGVSPQEMSITATVGLAFILGFAIRRTLGLLDIVKKRIFPDPTPAS